MSANTGRRDDRSLRPASGLPARGYTWEPFREGNQAALKHGAFSDRLVKPRAREIAQMLHDDGALPGYLLEARYAPALLAYCQVLAQIERVETWLASTATDGVPQELGPDGAPKAATRLLMDLERRADTSRRDLGLTPLAAARLGRDVAAERVSLGAWFAAQDDGGDIDG